ncbi:MAG TPA: choice-of-anchor Q domain-containing protein [Gaiellaceae bacterium]|jgi:hypothetical protein
MLSEAARSLIAAAAAVAIAWAFGVVGQAGAAPDQTVDVVVRDADCVAALPPGGDPSTCETVDHFKWLINADNSHADASVEHPASYSPVLATGDEANASGIVLPDPAPGDRGYLVSVLANDGVGSLNDPDYKIGGTHFTGSGTVVVELQKSPLPLATLKVRVFHDNQMLNSEDDIPLEAGLQGWHVTLADRVGEVTTDWYGNPICTQYETDADGTIIDENGDPVAESGGDPIPIPGTGGFCTTDSDGYATIPNLGPDKYEVEAIPPNNQWIQTTTIEGTKVIDAWVEEGHSGFSTEEGFTQAMVWFGFVRECQFGNGADDCTSATANATGTGSIHGTVRSISLDDESGIITLGNSVVRPYVGLNNLGGDDEQVYTARGNADGTFTIPNVPAGVYQLVIWDLPLDHIIQFVTVRVGNGQAVELGDIGVPPWFGTIKGSVYVDANEDGIRNPGEVGLRGQDLDARHKDGTIQYLTFSDNNGNYEFPEVFEWEHFLISEVGYGRFKQTGAAGYETDQFGSPMNYPGGFVNQDLGLASLLQATMTWGGTTNYIDWGKKPFDTSGCPAEPCENGGIVGIAFYAMTRNELDARLQANEDYEPGVPGTHFRLWAPVPCTDPTTQLCDPSESVQVEANGEAVRDHIAAVYDADSFNDSYPADCIPRGSVGRTAGQVEPNGDPLGEHSLFPECIELPALLPQIRSGVFDGGYAFDLDCTNAADPTGDADTDGVPNRLDEDYLLPYGDDCTPVASGNWVVEVVPNDGYKVVREEDINVFSGDTFVPAVPPPPCIGPLHTVDVEGVDTDGYGTIDTGHGTAPASTPTYNPDFADTPEVLAPSGFGSPYEGTPMPMCNERLIDLQDGFNANSDFFTFTDVPQPGRIVGVLLDDLVLELDPSSPMYAEKRGIPNAPIGIRDYTGKLVTTVYSDENGYWEVELPSTGTYNCPLPAGPCPGVYQVIGNDPGSPQHPNSGWNPNYGTLKLSFDVWPALTTYADVAILPITGFVQTPGPQFEPPVQCDVVGVPSLQEVSAVTVPSATGGSITLTGTNITGATLDGAAIPFAGGVATIPAGTAPGPHQLLATNGTGSSPAGITVHVLGGAYTPTVRDVGPGQTYATVQDGLDAAGAGDLVLVHPGVYFESVLVDKRVKLQGFGPGASVIDGRFFNFGGVSADDFADLIANAAYSGPTEVPMGQTITVLAEDGEFTAGLGRAQIDGFAIRGGSRVRGSRTAPSQGGGIYAHAFARNLEVSNNLIQSNAGNFGGGVILGQAYVTNPDAGNAPDSENDDVRIHHNRVLNNGGVSLAGGIALFNGANGTEIDHNTICGNYSAEYGGGISDFGMSSGAIHDNRILYNFAFDEGGGIMIAGEEPANPVAGLSAGTGAWNIQRNLIQGNSSNDDGGGIRLLTPVDGAVRIDNNMVVDNLATDSGGGISLDDALNVEIVNNTIAKNVSTATAEDADRSATCFNLPGDPARPTDGTCPHGAGLVSELHSAALMAQRSPAKDFTDPVLFNNVFWDNQARYLDGNQVVLGYTEPSVSPDQPFEDLEVLDLDNDDANRNYTSSNNRCTLFGPSCPNSNGNTSGDPMFVAPVDLSFDVLAFGGDPSFITVILKSKPGDPQGNYHLQAGSPAIDAGTTAVGAVSAPAIDFDGQTRGCPDQGADEAPGGAPTCGGGPPTPTLIQYMSFDGAGTVGGVAFVNEDVVGFNGTSWGMVLDGSDVGTGGGGAGIPNLNLDAVAMLDADSFLLSYSNNGTFTLLNGPGAADNVTGVDDADIVRFDAASLGSSTAGTFSMYFDGSDVGLQAGNNDEDLDALELNGGGALLISTLGAATVNGGGLSVVGQDIVRFAPTGLGVNTSGTWALRFDGSDVGLTTGGENIDAVANGGGPLFLSTSGGFTVPRPGPDLSGANEDVFSCTSPTLGPATACTWPAALTFDGSTFGLGALDLDGYERMTGGLP